MALDHLPLIPKGLLGGDWVQTIFVYPSAVKDEYFPLTANDDLKKRLPRLGRLGKRTTVMKREMLGGGIDSVLEQPAAWFFHAAVLMKFYKKFALLEKGDEGLQLTYSSSIMRDCSSRTLAVSMSCLTTVVNR